MFLDLSFIIHFKGRLAPPLSSSSGPGTHPAYRSILWQSRGRYLSARFDLLLQCSCSLRNVDSTTATAISDTPVTIHRSRRLRVARRRGPTSFSEQEQTCCISSHHNPRSTASSWARSQGLDIPPVIAISVNLASLRPPESP